MTNAELADELNDRLALTGPDAITANVIRQWVAWEVLPKATAQGQAIGKGPAWSRSDAAMRRALRLAELRQGGIKRQNALIVQAYIEWGHCDFNRVRSALLDEWTKWASQLNHKRITFLGNTNFQNISSTKKKAIATQIGPLDNIFKGTPFEQSAELYVVFSEFSRFGNGNSEYLANLMAGAFRRISPNMTQMPPASCILALANSFSGMTGARDEIDNSGASEIQNASQRQFRIARYHIRLILHQLQIAGDIDHAAAIDFNTQKLLQILKLIGPQISVGPWLIFAFTQTLKSISLR